MKNVSEACRVMGYEEGGIEALKEKRRRVPNVKNRVGEEVEQAAVEIALEDHVAKTGAVLTEVSAEGCGRGKVG